jgi:hypothetical protein
VRTIVRRPDAWPSISSPVPVAGARRSRIVEVKPNEVGSAGAGSPTCVLPASCQGECVADACCGRSSSSVLQRGERRRSPMSGLRGRMRRQTLRPDRVEASSDLRFPGSSSRIGNPNRDTSNVTKSHRIDPICIERDRGCRIPVVEGVGRGSYVLEADVRPCTFAHDLNPQSDLRYRGRLVRPYVSRSQDQLNPRFIRLLHPKSRIGISLTHALQRFFASGAVQKRFRPSAAKRDRTVAEDFILPDYA